MTSLANDNNFSSLSTDQWEDLCTQLLLAEGKKVVKLNGNGGDGGIDAFTDSITSPSVIYQYKHFKNGFGSAQADQAKLSLIKALALESHSGFKWILMSSADPTPTAAEKMQRLKEQYPDIEMEFHYGAEIRHRLSAHRSVRQQFYNDVMDFMNEALDDAGKGDFAGSFARKTRLLNEKIADDRFTATVASNGREEVVTLGLQPGIVEPVKLFKLTAKTNEAAAALIDSMERGADINLTGDDVDAEMLVDLGIVPQGAQLERVWSVHETSGKEILRRIFPSDEPGTPGMTVSLKVERSGTKETVVSNAHQASCPLIVTLTFHAGDIADGENKGRVDLNFGTRYMGQKLSNAIKGARFLAGLCKSKKFVIGGPDDEVGESRVQELKGFDHPQAQDRLDVLSEIKEAYDFFGVDPVLTEEIGRPGFPEEIRSVLAGLKWAQKPSCDTQIYLPIPEDADKAELETLVEDWSKQSRIKLTEDEHLDAFGYHLVATFTIEVVKPAASLYRQKNSPTQICVAGHITATFEKADSNEAEIVRPDGDA